MYISWVFSSLVFKLWGLCPNFAKCNYNCCCEHEDTLNGQHTPFNKFMNELLLKLNYICYAICSLFQMHQLQRPCSVEWPIIQFFLNNVSIIKVRSIEWQTTPNKYCSSILNYDAVSFVYTLPNKLTSHPAIQYCIQPGKPLVWPGLMAVGLDDLKSATKPCIVHVVWHTESC
jgi:hypothetical protein